MSQELQDKIQSVKDAVKNYPDFPKPGVLFRDMFSVFQNPELISTVREILVDLARKIQPPVECVVALDARGFLLGPFIALDLKVPFVPIRKKGKLPGKVATVTYTLEYGEDTLEIQEDSVRKGQAVLVVDDLLATGGSLQAACALVGKLGGVVCSCLVLMELTELEGRKKVPADVVSVIQY